MNKQGYKEFEEVKNTGLTAFSPNEFENVANQEEALILDTRGAGEFHKGFIPNSINIGLKGGFAPWVGAMIVDVKQPILLVVEEGTEEEAITRLSRVGFDNVLGYLKGGFEAWSKEGKEVDTIKRISAEEFAKNYKDGDVVIDVRNIGEYKAEHIDGAYSRPLGDIAEWAGNLDGEHFYLHCAGGYRSMIAGSILNSRGIRNYTEVDGGFGAIKKQENVPTTDFVCQSKTL